MANQTTVHAAIAGALAGRGLTTLFGVLGEGNIHLVDDLVQRHGVRYVKVTREDGAVLMAAGYAAVSGEVGFATVTHGPGLTNTVTALTQAARRREPVVVLAGATNPNVPLGRQTIDQAALVAPTGAAFQPVTSAETAVDEVLAAVDRARAERRPVVVHLPVNLQAERVAPAPPATEVGAGAAAPEVGAVAAAPDADALDRAVGVIASAHRPVVLAGRGAVLSGAREALLALAERIDAPVATTLAAKDWFRGEPFDLGICGSLGHGLSTETVLAADCLVVFGAGLNDDTTAKGSLVSGKRIVQVDIDADRLGERTPVTVGVTADARSGAATILEWLDELGHTREPAQRSEALRKQLAAYDPAAEITPFETDVVDGRRLTLHLDATFPADRTYVTDSGRFMLPGYAWLRVPEPAAFIDTVAFGSVGLGLATAIGAAIGRPDRPVLLTTGDGGLAMSLSELLTAVRYELDLVVVVYNDSAYGAEIAITDLTGMDEEIARLPATDFAAVARGMGAAAVTINGPDELPLIDEALRWQERPLVIDVKTDPRTPFAY